MRLFTFFFSIYLFALAVVPCADAMTIHEQFSQNSEFSQTDQHSENHQDLCTPFCTCSCCGISLDIKFASVFLKFPEAKSEFYKIIANRQTSLFSNYNGSIWQPPKITV
ncbi:DUF6660 family protein [Frigoriflavimonas asaccharolytica]|uniref:DUF6660 family protein n=1 Tax=Frigoriflavimonas asaccharolytica TaxID=2735899 RepID=UPI003622A159